MRGAHHLVGLRFCLGIDGLLRDELPGLRLRLLDMGLIPRTRVSLIKVAPMGDPKEIMVRGYVLTLRREDAARIEVVEDTLR